MSAGEVVQPSAELDAVAAALDEHLGCTLNDGPASAEHTGQDVWSCGIVLPFSERLEDAEQRHRAAAVVAARPPVVTHRLDCPIVEAATACGCMEAQRSTTPGQQST